MPVFTYRMQDLVTGAVLADLPLSCQGLPRNISGDADTQFTLALGDPRLTHLDPIGSTQPGRTAIFVLRDDVPVWGGIIWAREYQQGIATITLDASTIESYYRHRYWAHEHHYEGGIDQYTIAGGMLTGMIPVDGKTTWILADETSIEGVNAVGDEIDSDGAAVTINTMPANLHTPFTYAAGGFITGPLTGTDRTITFDVGKNVYDALTEMASLDDGFEWTFEPQRFTDGSLGWALLLGYPQLGRTDDESGLEFDFAGLGSNILDYSLVEDTAASANRVVTTGQEKDGHIPNKAAGQLSLLRAGYPLLEVSPNYADADEDAQVAARTFGDLYAADLPQTVTTWTVKADGDMGWGAFQLGDRAVFAVSDLFTPQQANGAAGRYSVERIVGWNLIPPEREQYERVELITNTLTQPSPKLPRSQERRLRRLETRLTAVATTSKVGNSKRFGSLANQNTVSVPFPTTTNTVSPWYTVSDATFVRGDYLTVYVGITVSTIGAGLAYDIRFFDEFGYAPPLVTFTPAIIAGSTNVFYAQWDLSEYDYGDMIYGSMQVRSYTGAVAPTGGNFYVRIVWLATGLPFAK